LYRTRAAQEGQPFVVQVSMVHLLELNRKSMRAPLLISIVTLSLFAAIEPAIAHHSFQAEYDASKQVNLMVPYPWKIVQTPTLIVFLYEGNMPGRICSSAKSI
jgi:hypothetical protein